jgi:hypothetical protein
MERLATSPVAPAVCCEGWLAGPSSVVRADMTLAWSGIGSAGRFAPPLAALHVVWPTLAVTGVPTGWPDRAAAEQFQPAADAEADMTARLAATAATTQSILRTKRPPNVGPGSTGGNDAGRRIKRFPTRALRRSRTDGGTR